MAGDAGRVFVDTSVIVAATVGVHPAHVASCKYVDLLVAEGTELCISLQVCREFLVVLTRQPVSGRTFSLEEALASLDVWMTGCSVLEETSAVLDECLRLVRQHDVRGKQVHDCNIAATMRAHGVERLATRNASDFIRYGDLIRLEAIEQ